MIYAGIDAGSRAIKIVLIERDSHCVLASGVSPQGVKSNEIAVDLFTRLLMEAGGTSEDVAGIVATGYARNSIELADKTVTEITCHASGVKRLIPEVRTAVEIGGQDSKLLRFDEGGILHDFAMNDRCAAGTGRFLEMVASQFDVKLSSLGNMAARSTSPASVSSMCVVFAETEILGLLAEGVTPENIVAGVQRSIAMRVAAMAGGKITPPVVFTGGVALIGGMDKALEDAIGHPVCKAPNPQMTGALGAAILAAGQLSRIAVADIKSMEQGIM